MSDNKPLDFESWYKTTNFWKMDNCMAKKIARDAWQAAIDSRVVDLPEHYMDKFGDMTLDYSATIRSLNAAGVKYK